MASSIGRRTLARMAKKQGRVTIAQIAAAAGAALSTVSNVLNGKFKESGASPQRIAQIQAVARRLNYRPSSAARAMRTGRCDAIALVLSAVPGRITPFVSLWLALTAELHRRQLSLTVAQVPDAELTDEAVVPRLLSEWSVDGLLIDYVRETPPGLRELMRVHGVPATWINTRLDADCVHPDDEGAVRDATARLLQAGHRRIAWVATGRNPHYSDEDRAGGYTRAMRSAGRAARAVRPRSAWTAGERLAHARALLSAEDRPTAILTYGPDDALPLLIAATALGLAVPQDLALVTINDTPVDSSGIDLPTLLIPTAAMAEAAVEMLTRRIATPRAQPAQAIPFGWHLGVGLGQRT